MTQLVWTMTLKPKYISSKFLSSDEHLVFESRPSAFKFMVSGSIVMLIGIIALVIFAWKWIPNAPSIPYISDYLSNADYGQFVQLAFGAVFFLALIYFFYKWLRWNSTIYAVTDERIILQTKILAKEYDDIELMLITNVETRQTLGQRLLGYGTLVFSTQGTTDRKTSIKWDWVPDPMDVRKKIQEVMDIRVKPPLK